MSKKMWVVVTTVVFVLLGGCTSYNGSYGGNSGSESHAGHSH